MKRYIITLLIIAFVFSFNQAIFSQPQELEYIHGEIIVKFKEEIASTLDSRLSTELELSLTTTISSIDTLNAKYKVKRTTHV